MRIRPLLRQDRKEALARLVEILNLLQRVNSWGSRELSFFLSSGAELDFKVLKQVVSLLEAFPASDGAEQVERAVRPFRL